MIAALILATLAMFASPPLPPCPTEDSVSCHWDAATQGNGLGLSFDSDASGRITYTH